MLTVLITRPLLQSAITAQRLNGLGFTVLECPLFDIEQLRPDLPAAQDFQAVLLTSANAAPALTPYLELPVYTVGDTTAEAARAAGAKQVTSAARDAEALLALVQQKLKPEAGKLLYLCGTERAMDVPGTLAPAGFTVEVIEVYSSTPQSKLPAPAEAALKAGATVLLYSPRAARHFRALLDDAGLKPAGITIAALSPKVAEAAGLGWAKVVIAAEPNETSLMQALLPTAATCYTDRMSRFSLALALLALLVAAGTPFWSPHLQPAAPLPAAVDLAPLNERLATLEAANTSLRDELDKLRTAQANLSSQTDVLTRIDALAARVNSVEGAGINLGQLQAEVATLKEQATAKASLDVAARVRLSHTLQLLAALQNGEPFAASAAALSLELPTELQPYIERGVPTLTALVAAFPAVARGVLQAEAPKGEGWVEQSLNSVKRLVTIRRQGDVAGETTEAVLARAEQSLQANNLKAALGALTPLGELPALASWLSDAKARLAAAELGQKLTGEVAASLSTP